MVSYCGFEFTLARIFNDIWRSLEWPEEWNLATLIPLYKKAGDVRDLSSYLACKVLAVVPKIRLNRRRSQRAHIKPSRTIIKPLFHPLAQ